MGVIAYDQPVKDLIAGLDATGHVTHTAYRKTSVTFHHNGGRLSHEGVLEVWKTREASAHFDVDGSGAVAQYVRVNEYAWATGNTQGNQSSISIEMADATLAPDYVIADATWRSAARLAGWLFARVIGVAPTPDTVHLHHDWKATTCAGPFMDKIRAQLFQAVLDAYNEFAKNVPQPAPPSPAPTPPAPTGTVEEIAREVIAGQWGNGPERQQRLTTAGYDAAAVQAAVNRLLSGGTPAPAPVRQNVHEVALRVIAGDYGNGPDRSARLVAAGYNSMDVQVEVNRILGGSGGTAPTRNSISLLASQVVAGQWGNGTERASRLTAAGYDAAAVQAEVNRRLRG
jgi:hypothetical protein